MARRAGRKQAILLDKAQRILGSVGTPLTARCIVERLVAERFSWTPSATSLASLMRTDDRFEQVPSRTSAEWRLTHKGGRPRT